MELDNENNRTVFLKESDPFMPILPSPERQEEILEEGLKRPPSMPIHSPHAFLKKDRWLFSPPPVLTPEDTNLDKFETECEIAEQDTKKEQNPKTIKKGVTRPSSLIFPSTENPPRKRIRSNTVTTLLGSNSARKPDTPVPTENTHFRIHPILLVRSVNPPPLLQIVPRPTPELVRNLTNSCIPYVSSPVCQKYRK